MAYRECVLASFSIPAAAWYGATTAGAAGPVQTEHGTNDVDVPTMDFDQTTKEYAQHLLHMPEGWDGGTFTAEVCWTAAAGAGAVVWGIEARAYTNDDAIDQAWGTAVEVTDTLLATGDYHKAPESAAVTPAGTPAGGQCMVLRLYRDPVDAGDTLTADAKMIAVSIRFTKNISDD